MCSLAVDDFAEDDFAVDDFAADFLFEFEIRNNRNNYAMDRQLEFYLTSTHYDCTFSAARHESKEGSCAKNFKCHKLILAAASTAFEVMLYGSFKEAYQGRDDEIKLEVSPTAFDLAMRFIYGRQSDFQSCEIAVEIYRFAHKWMFEGLVQESENFINRRLNCDSVLLVYEMCIDLNIVTKKTVIKRKCLKIIEHNTRHVLTSKQWLGASQKTITKICRLRYLNVREDYLFKMLILWGEARCSNDQSKSVRAEIDPMLKHIRFRSMSFRHFSAISKKCDVLTTEEKFKIMESIKLSDSNLMPPKFSLLDNRRRGY